MPSDPPSTPARTGRIGLFGGTFDPPHIGHLLTGQNVAEARRYDQIWFVVANDPWQKSSDRVVSPAALRFSMVAHACYWSRHPLFVLKASEIEIRAGGPSYTADTLRALGASYPDTEFEVIIGSDAAQSLHTWYDASWLAENAHFVVVQRGGHLADPSPGFNVSVVDAPLIELSSTQIRSRVRSALPVGSMVPPPVEALLNAHALYRDAPQ